MMKLCKKNHTYFHFTNVYHCSTATVSSGVISITQLLYHILCEDCMKTVPSREREKKNKTSLLGSFIFFENLVKSLIEQILKLPLHLRFRTKKNYLTYRGMHSFTVLLEVAPIALMAA